MVFEVTIGLLYTIFGITTVFLIMGLLLAIGWPDIKRKILYYTHFTTHGWFYWMKPNGMILSRVLPLGDTVMLKTRMGKGKKRARLYQVKNSRRFTNSSGGNIFYSENKNPIDIHSIMKIGQPQFMDDSKVAAAINTLSYDQGYIDGGGGLDNKMKMMLGGNIVLILALVIVGIYVLINGVPA